MIQLDELIKPTWGIEKSINNAWSVLNDDEKTSVKNRLDNLFYNELPFQLEHDKILYIHIFSLFAQLEAIGLAGLTKSLEKLSGSPLYQKMRQHVADEVFHTVIFAKLAFHLSAPYSLPLGNHKTISHFTSFIEHEDDLATSLAIVNLVGEGWIEELFLTMKNKGIAANIFEMVLEDESRHLNEYDLYQHIGLPDKKYFSKKLETIENGLIDTLFSQVQYITSIVALLGREDTLEFFGNVDKKQHSMLKKIGVTPSKSWQFFMGNLPLLLKNVYHDFEADTEFKSTNMRKILSSMWNDPELPTESAVFSINVSPVCFFEKKFKSETITCLMLQALSKVFFDNPQTSIYMSNHKFYRMTDSYVALAVQLPDCDDQLGSIEFKNCHEMSMTALSQHIKNDISIMTYCYKKTQELQKEHPYLSDSLHNLLSPRHERAYHAPFIAKPAVSLSNIGHWGYETAVSPLFPNETLKFTLTKIERKQVWNNTINQFEVQDLLPVGMSVDHRVFDGNIPMPYYTQAAFDHMFMDMEQSTPKPLTKPFANLKNFIEFSNKLLDEDLDFGFILLFSLTGVWKNYESYENLVSQIQSGFYKQDTMLERSSEAN